MPEIKITIRDKVAIANGGTGADNAADALNNLGAASVAYVDEKIAQLQEQINSLS